ncbi:hypothetical protein [Nesterenkonia sp. HG001]|uniref:hypothetical protein n=1 Tax=Nesterenkonia sp. HG001 TaxID=2983207 RepID=UPI002AC6A477|nr:hypothetical protein [Nesterenkonia sp. HG001]MDZ5076722.1 hypothetical protein [Nesterenkonia sp. HG001]
MIQHPRSPGWPQLLWSRLQEPRLMTAAHIIAYATIAAAGASVLMDPPASISTQIGHTMTTLWGLMSLIGGAVAMIACPAGRWMIEKPALVLCATGVLLYGLTVFGLHWTTDGNRLPQALILAALFLHLAGRFVYIRPFSYEPGK